MKINCKNIRCVAQDYLSDELPEKERKSFLEHLDECAECFSHMEYQSILKKTVQKKMLGVKGSKDLKSKIMKNLVVVFLFAAIAVMWCKAGDCQGSFPDPTLYNEVLEYYVEDGVVAYQSLAMAPSRLYTYLDALAAVEEETFDAWSEREQIAFLINLYNASTLRLIIDHYPVKSIKKIREGLLGPWDLKVVRLFGEKVTLNKIEHKILRKKYNEPRIHFALVCAAKGCPPLRSEAYDPFLLDAQLDEQGKIFLREEDKNYIDLEEKVLYLSPIFKWFKKDFLKSTDSLEEYVYSYFPTKDFAGLQSEKVKIKYTDYDWSLNV